MSYPEMKSVYSTVSLFCSIIYSQCYIVNSTVSVFCSIFCCPADWAILDFVVFSKKFLSNKDNFQTDPFEFIDGNLTGTNT